MAIEKATQSRPPQLQQPGVATEESALPLALKGGDRICMKLSQRNSKYLAFLRNRPCSFCLGRECEPHHVFKEFRGISTGGLGKKGNDYLSIATCSQCHGKIHAGKHRPDRIDYLELIIISLICYITRTNFAFEDRDG